MPGWICHLHHRPGSASPKPQLSEGSELTEQHGTSGLSKRVFIQTKQPKCLINEALGFVLLPSGSAHAGPPLSSSPQCPSITNPHLCCDLVSCSSKTALGHLHDHLPEQMELKRNEYPPDLPHWFHTIIKRIKSSIKLLWQSEEAERVHVFTLCYTARDKAQLKIP